MRHLYLKPKDSGEVDSIPVKVALLCEVYRVISRNQRYLEALNKYFVDDRLTADYKDSELTLSLLEVQIGMGVKYAKAG